MTGAASDDIMKKHYGDDFDNPLYADGKHNSINRASIAAALTFTLGICQLLVGALRLNFIFAYFSDPLVGGFSTGAAIHVIVSQFDGVLDISSGHENGPGYLFGVLFKHASNIAKANVYTVGLSLIVMVILLIGKDLVSPFINKKAGRNIPIPYDLILVSSDSRFQNRGIHRKTFLDWNRHVSKLSRNLVRKIQDAHRRGSAPRLPGPLDSRPATRPGLLRPRDRHHRRHDNPSNFVH